MDLIKRIKGWFYKDNRFSFEKAVPRPPETCSIQYADYRYNLEPTMKIPITGGGEILPLSRDSFYYKKASGVLIVLPAKSTSSLKAVLAVLEAQSDDISPRKEQDTERERRFRK